MLKILKNVSVRPTTVRITKNVVKLNLKQNFKSRKISLAVNTEAKNCASSDDGKKAQKAQSPESKKKKPNAVHKVKTVKEKLMKPIAVVVPTPEDKITIVGAGKVGMACAICILTQNVTNELCLIDTDEKKLMGEVKDLQHGANFLNNAKITGSSNYEASKDSRICIITAGTRREKNESNLELLSANADLIQTIVPQLIKYSPNTILIIISNPCDVLAYYAWKLSGLPLNHVFGTGTSLDTSRLRFLVSQRLDIVPDSCRCWIIGEHDSGFVPVWSTANVAGVRLRELNPKVGLPDDPEHWNALFPQIQNAAYEIRQLKGSTSLAIAMSVSTLAKSILADHGNIDSVSTSIRGLYGIDKDIFLSMPCVLNKYGISKIIKLKLTDVEKEQLLKSAEKLEKAQDCLQF